MPPRDWQLRVQDILGAVEKIARYTRGQDFDTFCADDKTVDAVIRNLTVLGEAARHLDETIVRQLPELPWTEMRDMRNIIVHEYFGVSLEILWQTIQEDLPALVRPLEELLAQNAENL